VASKAGVASVAVKALKSSVLVVVVVSPWVKAFKSKAGVDSVVVAV